FILSERCTRILTAVKVAGDRRGWYLQRGMGWAGALAQAAAQITRGGCRMAHLSNPEFQALRIAVLTISDTRTLVTDGSGQTLADCLEAAGHALYERALVPDDIWQIRARLCAWSADPLVQVVLLTGGTGFTARDNTPQAV